MASDPKLHRQPITTRYGFLWVTLVLFAGSVIGHWLFGWFAYADEQQMHGETARFIDYSRDALRDMLENWQAEFFGVAWQILGLRMLYAVGSPQSKENHDRTEEKIDLILKKLDPDAAEKEIARIDRDYARV